MNKQTCIEKIQAIIDGDKKNQLGKQEIPWEDGLKTMEVYKIPLAYLVIINIMDVFSVKLNPSKIKKKIM